MRRKNAENGEISKMQFHGNEGTQRPEIMEYETEQREKTDENQQKMTQTCPMIKDGSIRKCPNINDEAS